MNVVINYPQMKCRPYAAKIPGVKITGSVLLNSNLSVLGGLVVKASLSAALCMRVYGKVWHKETSSQREHCESGYIYSFLRSWGSQNLYDISVRSPSVTLSLMCMRVALAIYILHPVGAREREGGKKRLNMA